MPVQAANFLRQVEAELDTARERVTLMQRSILSLVGEIRDLAEQRTGSFIELARHYLPDLTHQSIVGAWSEVRGEIEDLLLRKNDQQRGLRKQHAELESKKQQLRTELDELGEKAEHAKSVLSCKMGNYRKRLREDPEILRIDEAIKRTDQQIELALSQQEFAEDEARKKLPDYEECALFDYLRDRQFGTPAYKARGIERRWDRWVAKLIEYKDAKKSFDLLNETPAVLKALVKEKQAQYLKLLEQLESAQNNAKTEFGIYKQTEVWQSLCAEMAKKEREIEQFRAETDELHDHIIKLDDIEGEYYREAIEVYRTFLTELEPNVLKVYASCTDSPVDDEICARLRNIQDEIDSAHERSSKQKQAVVAGEKYVAALHDLASRLRSHLQGTLGTVFVYSDLNLPRLLGRIHTQDLAVDDVWQQIRESMIRPKTKTATLPARELGSSTGVASKMSPLNACYTAASEQTDGLMADDGEVDPSGIVLVGAPVSEIQDEYHAGFTVLAVCGSKDEAHFLVAHLESQSIPSFVRTRYGDTIYAGRQFESDEYHVVVDSRKHARAAELLLQLQRTFSSAWECPRCLNRIDSGRDICWSCGRQRTL